MYFCLIFLSFLLKIAIAQDSATLDQLRLDRYDINERPRHNREAVQVNVSINVQDLEWKNNELTMLMFFIQKWNDDRLASNAENPVLVRTNQLKNRMWTPDTFIIEAVFREVVEAGTIKVQPNGNINWIQMMKIRIPCTMTFDDALDTDGNVNCSMDMESFGFTTQGITYDWSVKNPIVVVHETIHKPFARCTGWEKSVKMIELPSGTYGRLSATFKFETIFTKQVLHYIGTKAMETYT